MDPGLAAVLGAGVGALATLLGNDLQLQRDGRRHQRELREARAARLLDRRLVAHESLYSILMRKIDYAEDGAVDRDYPESRRAMWIGLDRVQIISSAEVSDVAEATVRAIAFVEKQLASHSGPRQSPEWDERVAALRPLAQRYRELLVAEIGASD